VKGQVGGRYHIASRDQRYEGEKGEKKKEKSHGAMSSPPGWVGAPEKRKKKKREERGARSSR